MQATTAMPGIMGKRLMMPHAMAGRQGKALSLAVSGRVAGARGPRNLEDILR